MLDTVAHLFLKYLRIWTQVCEFCIGANEYVQWKRKFNHMNIEYEILHSMWMCNTIVKRMRTKTEKYSSKQSSKRNFIESEKNKNNQYKKSIARQSRTFKKISAKRTKTLQLILLIIHYFGKEINISLMMIRFKTQPKPNE